MRKPTLLIVDDEPVNLALLARLLNSRYRVLGARSGHGALTLMANERPDLVLLDVMMPEMDGYTVLQRMRRDPRLAAVPVIFVTALGGELHEERGLALGAVDYIVKPLKPAVVLARVATHLELAEARDRLAQQNRWLEGELARRLREIELAQDLTITALAELAEARDHETGHHILRTQRYVELLAQELARGPYAAELDEAQCVRITKAAPMHDIGKIGIPDAILLKPGRLTPEEFEHMKRHAQLGGDTIAQAMQRSLASHPVEPGQPMPEALLYLEVARQIATHHHERWDGNGYPGGLAGHAIPLPARLMALADVFDALTMRRVYKAPWPLERTVAHVRGLSGLQFDPLVVQAFERLLPQFEATARELADPDPAPPPPAVEAA
ncbi:HD-GYP domain-containing protein [Ideonella livida]|uniref:Response regulator n=1 Tax=Ideonella livida TaxID=2707176 RepID=A0A7C9TKZ5_9BURK|nr:HD domain-containing phosphohydrolase [Ideonella livida]NDY93179.1 response regulator [Ideonella livida]